MRLYYSPGACSLASHIVARETGLNVELSKVSFSAEGRTTEQGEDFYAVNPRGGYVPALRMDDGAVLVEGVAILQYLGDHAPEKGLMPEKGTLAHYRLLESLTYINSEMHKGFSTFFKADASEAEKTAARDRLMKRYAFVDGEVAKHDYLNEMYTVADAYLYTILRWSPKAGIEVSGYANLAAYMKRMEAREAVKTALAEEGLPEFEL